MKEYAEKRGYLLEDYRLFHLSDAQGTQIEYHYHEFCKLLILRSGSGRYAVEDKKYVLDAGDIVLIPGRCVHRPEFESGMPYERTIIYISPEFLRKNSTPNCNLFQLFDRSVGYVLRPDLNCRKIIFSAADLLELELQKEGEGQDILQDTSLLRLLVQTVRALRYSENIHLAPSEVTNGRILEIQRYIDRHLEEDITIDLLAEKFYISKYHMMRQFQKETGVSIHTYLIDRRLFWARERIRQGMNATESCFQSGFRSYSSFTRAYVKRFGTTPTGRRNISVSRDETFE